MVFAGKTAFLIGFAQEKIIEIMLVQTISDVSSVEAIPKIAFFSEEKFG